MSFASEWARIKQEVAGEPVLKLAHGDAGPADDSGGSGGSSGSSGSGITASDRAAWNAAAEAVGTLAGNVKTASGKLLAGQSGLDAMARSGIASVQEQSSVYLSWNAYLYNVQARCAALQGHLSAAGKALHYDDATMKASFDALDDGYPYADTAPFELGPGPMN